MQQKTRSIILAILGLSLIVVVHESGHFLMCKLFDVKTPIFSVGFGPVLLSYTINNTAFQLAALPLGGYVAIDAASLATKTYLQKLAINVAGIAFNIIFALLLLIYLTWLANKKKTIPIITEIMPDSPASAGSLFSGDRIITINGTHVRDDGTLAITTLHQLPGQHITLTIERNGMEYEVPITLEKDHPLFGKHVGWLGASFKTINASPSLLATLYNGIITTYKLIIKMASAMFGIWRKKERSQVMGPIGIITNTAEQPAANAQFFMIWWLVLINLNVAIFNILPIPLLDGGHIALDTIEALYGKPLPPHIIQNINLLFLLLFLGFLFVISMRDIQRLKTKK